MSAAPAPDDTTGLAALPLDVEAEQALLGACLQDPKQIAALAAIMEAGDFYDPLHRRMWQTMVALDQAQMAVTPLTVRMRMRDDPGLAELKLDYVATLVLAAPSCPPLAQMGRAIADLAMRRHAMMGMIEAHEALSRRDSDIVEVLAPFVETADRAASRSAGREFVSVADAAAAMLKRAEDVASGKPIVAATTGVSLLDEAIGGLQAGDLAVYAGRPGMGKSSILMASALRTAMIGRPVLFFSLEMTQAALLQRLGCDLDFDEHPSQPISYSWFRNGSARHADIGRLAEALRKLPASLSIFERGGMTIHEIAALSRAHASKSKTMGLVVIDYLQKVSAGDRYKGNRVQEVTEISGAAKALAMRLGWPVLVGAQLNRGVENREEKRPTLTDLRESGSIEQDADAVIGMYRPGYYIGKRKPALGQTDPAYPSWAIEWEAEKNRLDLLILKNRNGEEDNLSVFCDMRASAIRNERPSGVR